MIIMQIVKADGARAEFDREKIVGTCIRAGTSKEKAEQIVDKILPAIRDGTTTHEIYKLILNELDKMEDKSSFIFRLREVVAKLVQRLLRLLRRDIALNDALIMQLPCSLLKLLCLLWIQSTQANRHWNRLHTEGD